MKRARHALLLLASLTLVSTSTIAKGEEDNRGIAPSSIEIEGSLNLPINSHLSISINSPTNTQTLNGELVVVTGTAVAEGDHIGLVEVFEGSNLVGTFTGGSESEEFSILWPTALPGTYFLTAVVTDSSGLKSTSAPPVMITVDAIIARNAEWKYQDYNIDPGGLTWTEIEFDDWYWPIGAAPLGAGDDHIRTTVNLGYGGSRNTSILYRKSINIPSAAAYESLIFRLLRDDGANVFINGVQVFADNAPEEFVFSEFSVINPVSAPDETTYFRHDVPTDLLVDGVNVISVACKQAYNFSSDIGFDLEVVGVIDDQPPLQLSENPRRNAIVRTLNQITVVFSEPVTNVEPSDLTINGVEANSVNIESPEQATFGFAEPAVGVVQVTWNSLNGIIDLAPLSNPFFDGSWIYTLDPNAPLPVITQQPNDLTVLEHTDAIFCVEVDPAAAPYTYQWQFNGNVVPGATNDILILPQVALSEAGNYRVLVQNLVDSVTSTQATLTVLPVVDIVEHPVSVSTNAGGNAVFSVVATSSTSIVYQWRKNQIPVVGANSSSLTVTNVQPIDAGIYDVVMTDEIGSVTSDEARLTVLVAPNILFPTRAMSLTTTNAPGSSVTLSIAVNNAATLPVYYRWRKSGVGIAPVRSINARVDFLTITNFQAADAGSYSCVVTNQAFPAPGFLSGRFNLLLGEDTDGDGMPDHYEEANGLDKTMDDAGQDADLDGFTNEQEFLAGTNPQDPQSFLRIEEIEKESAIIRFIAQPGKTYVIQARDRSHDGQWTYLHGLPASNEPAHVVEVIDKAPPVNGQRYYRLVTPGTSRSGGG